MKESERNERVDAAIAEYLAACDAGRPPERSRFLAQHPDLATSLVPFLDDHMQMKRAASPFGPDLTLAQDGFPPFSTSERVKYVGDYELLHEIAQGGMGVVYQARQSSLNRDVAVKMILAGRFAKPSDQARFRLEAEAAANLDHPNILPIYEVGKHEERPYFSMKLITGGSFADLLSKRSTTTVRSLVSQLAKVCRAVHFAHQHGVLHRDLKPANILIDDDGTPYVTDFGLAKKTDSDDGATKTGAVLGTPGYMPPEQARGEKGLSTAVDVYSLGAILYEIITGQPPFRGETVYETIKQVIEVEPVEPRVVDPTADRDLAAIALKCLAKTPTERYSSTADLADDLDRWLNGEPTIARPPGSFALIVRWLRHNTAAAVGLIAFGTVAGLLAVFTPFSLVPNNTTFLLPSHASSFHPLAWFNAAQHHAVIRYGLIATSTVFLLGGGWLIQVIIRPQTRRAALGAGAAVGLLATLVAFAYLGPIFASITSNAFSTMKIHPIAYMEDIFQRGDSEQGLGNTFVPPRDAAYLEQFLTPEERELDPYKRKRALENLQRRALDANRMFNGLVMGWLVLGFVGSFIMTWAIHGAWAADYLARSPRHPFPRVLTYWELVILVMGLVLFTLIVIGVTIAVNSPNVTGGPMWASRLIPLISGIVLVTLAHLGVVRQWHPIFRFGLYFSVGVVATGVMWIFGCFT